jgi:hypothetical protein
MGPDMTVIADFLLAAGAFGAALYCYVLSARLKRFTALETGMGGAIAVLSAQVDDMTIALEQARRAATGSATGLDTLVGRAESTAARLELMLASMHDLPDTDHKSAVPPTPAPEPERRRRVVRNRVSRVDAEAVE